MAWTDLKDSIAQVIRTNGNQEITGALLQLTLTSIVDQLGANATLKGVATPATNPNTSDGIAFYIASELGTYANFGGLKVNSGEIAVFYSNGTEWTKMSIDLTQTIAESISDSEATLRREIAESEGRSDAALSTARGAIDEVLVGVVNALKQRAYTLDFGTDSDLAHDSNLLGSITINNILTQNVSALFLSYGSVVRQSVPTSGTVSLQIPDGTILIWEIVRAKENEPACVGVRFEILTEE